MPAHHTRTHTLIHLTQCFNGVGILSHHPKRCLVVMVDLVHVLVEPSVVHELVDPVVPGVLQHQTTKQLQT